ncbi:MAG: 30S ribosomal protein S20 [Desulfobacteraceae bacterium 4484_190.1]|nr:MAG: 30S ribosomal protein S20 [Desulfobacteraceae bacterium 4484_190.1]
MANHKSAIKRAKQNEVRRLQNKHYKTKVKHTILKVRDAISENSVDGAQDILKSAVSTIHKAVSNGVIHKNNAARKISRLTRQINQIKAS